MADDKGLSGPDESQQIDLNSDSDVSYWAEKLNLSSDRLREIVQQVGPRLQDVQLAIGKYTPGGNPR